MAQASSTNPSSTLGAAIIAAVRARGSDANDVRDAAHEAAHALDAGAKRWGRESIHRALLKKHWRPATLVRAEIEARAIEQLVCTEAGVDCGPIDKWAFISWLEASKHGLPMLPSVDMIITAVQRAMKSKDVIAKAKAVVALANPSPPRKRMTKPKIALKLTRANGHASDIKVPAPTPGMLTMAEALAEYASTGVNPFEACASCGVRRDVHKLRHVFKEPM